jgi:ABC-type Na+ efflux pump permease subunit
MLVAMADLKMAMQVKYVKFGIVGMGALGPILAILMVAVPIALLPDIPGSDMLLGFLISMSATILAMMAVIPATLIAANALVGEREQDTLEPLLCTPLTDRELLWGKTLSSLIPSMAILLGGTAVVMIVVNIVLVVYGKPLMLVPDLAGLFLILTAGPAIILAAVSMNILISGKVKRVYEAYQTSGMIILVLMIPMFAPLIGMESEILNMGMVWIADILTVLIAVILMISTWALAVRRFNRDRMISLR